MPLKQACFLVEILPKPVNLTVNLTVNLLAGSNTVAKRPSGQAAKLPSRSSCRRRARILQLSVPKKLRGISGALKL